MNKRGFIEELVKKTGFNEEQCKKINKIIEETFFVGRKNKETLITKFMEQLNISDKKADELYNKVSSIIAGELKNKVLPFLKK